MSKTILTQLAEDASPEAIAADTVKNADAFAELIQYLDDISLSLIIRDAAQATTSIGATVSSTIE